MIFNKYHSLINSYELEHIFNLVDQVPELKNETYVITEKLHGCNIQITAENGSFNLGSRNKWVTGDSELYNVSHYLKDIAEVIVCLTYDATESGKTYTLYGEFFGKGIHKELHYGEKSFRFFGLSIDGQKQSFSKFLDYMTINKLRHWVIPIRDYIVGLDTALKADNTFQSSVSAHGEFCEGVVIEPLYRVYIYKDSVIAFKNKNEKFMEAKQIPKPARELPEGILALREEFKNLIVEQRVKNIFSKEGPITDNKDIGRYVSLLINDAKEEFYRLYPDLNLNSKDERPIFKIGNMGFELIKRYME